MSNKKKQNNKQNQNANHESQEELQHYFNNPTSGEYQNNKLHKNNQSNH